MYNTNKQRTTVLMVSHDYGFLSAAATVVLILYYI